jgi:hypothetical protein
VTTFERGGGPRSKILLFPRRVRVTRGFYKQNFPKAKPPPAFTRIYRNATWRVYAAPGCA